MDPTSFVVGVAAAVAENMRLMGSGCRWQLYVHCHLYTKYLVLPECHSGQGECCFPCQVVYVNCVAVHVERAFDIVLDCPAVFAAHRQYCHCLVVDSSESLGNSMTIAQKHKVILLVLVGDYVVVN